MNPTLHPITEAPLRFWHRDAVVERHHVRPQRALPLRQWQEVQEMLWVSG